jgi:hypothetical protein
MTGNSDKFLTLRKERNGSVPFGNDNLAKIIGEGTIRIGNKYKKYAKCSTGRRYET